MYRISGFQRIFLWITLCILLVISYRKYNPEETLLLEISHYDDTFLINRIQRVDRLLESMTVLRGEGLFRVHLLDAVEANSKWIQSIHEKMNPSSRRSANEVAVFASHVQILRKIVAENLPFALILEDDIDMNVGALIQSYVAMNHFSTAWDMIFLGHCMEIESGEIVLRENPHLRLERSVMPRCAHAYRVSQLGAQKLLRLLPPISDLSDPIDELYRIFIQEHQIESFSFHPFVVSQYDSKSDLRERKGPDDQFYDLFPPLVNSSRSRVIL